MLMFVEKQHQAHYSPHKDGVFLPINCPELSNAITLLKSEFHSSFT